MMAKGWSGALLVVLVAISTVHAGEPLEPVLTQARVEARRWQPDARLVQMEFTSFGYATGMSGIPDLTKSGPPRFAMFQFLSPSVRRSLLVTVEINRSRSTNGDKRVWIEPLSGARGRFSLPIPERLAFDLEDAIGRAEKTLAVDCQAPTATPATCAIVQAAELHVQREDQAETEGPALWTIQFGRNPRTHEAIARTVDAMTGQVSAVSVMRQVAAAADGVGTMTAQAGRRSTEPDRALSGLIAPARATVTGLRFFEAPSPLPADPQRNYDDIFLYSAARYVYWELSLTHAAPGRSTSFTIEEIWQGPGISHRTSRTFTLQPDWTSSVFFGGARLMATRTVEMTSPSYSAAECERQRRTYRGGGEPPACAPTIPVDINSWPPGTYQVDLLVDKRPVARGWFAMSTKEQIQGEVEARSADRSAPTGTIAAVAATVTALRFSEAGATASPRAERRHTRQFAQGTTRSIAWEIDLKHAAPGRWTPLTFEALLYRVDGGSERVVQRKVLQTAIPGDWADTFHSDQFDWSSHYYRDRAGSTTPSPPRWLPGAYRVDLYVAETKVASGSFEVR